MSTITTLNSTDSGSTSRGVINTNFSNLNTDKAESSTLTAHTGASTSVHGANGTLVGTTDTQTLTNKTLTTPTIGSFANSNHNHTNSAGGGQLTDAALSSAVTVSKGGTGATTLANNGILLGQGTSAVATIAAGTATYVLTANGTASAPTFQAPSGGLTGFGAWDSATVDGAGHQVANNSILVGWAVYTSGGISASSIKTDSNATPSTERIQIESNNVAISIPFSCPVKKNDYYSITAGSGQSITAYIIPLS